MAKWTDYHDPIVISHARTDATSRVLFTTPAASIDMHSHLARTDGASRARSCLRQRGARKRISWATQVSISDGTAALAADARVTPRQHHHRVESHRGHCTARAVRQSRPTQPLVARDDTTRTDEPQWPHSASVADIVTISAAMQAAARGRRRRRAVRRANRAHDAQPSDSTDESVSDDTDEQDNDSQPDTPGGSAEIGAMNLIAQAQDSDRANERDLPDGVEEEVQYATMTATNLFVGSVTGCVEGTSRAVSPEQSALALTLTTATIVAFAVDHQHPATSLLAASSDKPVVEPLFPTTVQMHDARPLEVGAQPMSVMGFANNNTRVRVHLDSGASSSAVSEAWCHRHRDIVTPTLGNGGRSQRLTFTGFTAGETGATHTVVIKVTIGRTSFVNRFWVVRDCPVDLLIGQDNMGSDEGKGMHLFPDPRRGTVLFEATGEKVACVSSDAPAPTVCLLQDVAAQPESMALLPVRTPHRSTTLHIAAQAKDGWYAHEQVVCTDELGMTHMFIANSGVDTELWEKHRPFNIAMSGTSASSVTAIMQTQTSPAGTRMKDDTDTTTIEDFAASREGGSRPDAPVTGEDLKRGSMWQPCATIDAEKKRPMTEKELSAHLTSLVRANKLLSRHSARACSQCCSPTSGYSQRRDVR